MRIPAFSPLLVALLVSGCQGALWGNLAMFVVAVGIFMGTITLGRGR
jgi:hypothetical protein